MCIQRIRLATATTGRQYGPPNDFPRGHCLTSSSHFKGECPINIFFDTEFTGLTSDPHLLSIGLVADNGESLYIEFTNGWSETDCSNWVREHVMPMLGHGERLTRRDAGARITTWLESFESSPTLLGETTWDTTLFSNLMHECGVTSDRFLLVVLAFSGKEQAMIFETTKRSYLESLQLTAHHALSDAWAFRSAWHNAGDLQHTAIKEPARR